MFARISIIPGTPEKAEAAVRGPIPSEVREAPGFRGAYGLLDRQQGKVMLITLWESEQAMRDSTERVKASRAQIAQEAGAATAPVVETYEVINQWEAP